MTGELTFPFAEPPPPGEVREVAAGVLWLRMPLPFALDHINLWVLDDGDGWTLIDTGIDTEATRELWEKLLMGPLGGKPVRRLICTHFHPDHMGLAGWLHRKLAIPAYATTPEWDRGVAMHALNSDDFLLAMIGMAEQAGCTPEQIDDIRKRRTAYRRTVAPPPETRLDLEAESAISAAQSTWRIVIGEGHSPRLAALHSETAGVLISGDQVLPKITPNVSVLPDDPTSDPLSRFLDSLERFRTIPDDVLVLPSHRLPFRGLHTRLDQMRAHHHERLDRTREACSVGASAAEVMAKLFPRRLDGHQVTFALGETLAHLNYMIGLGEIRRGDAEARVTKYTLV